MRLLFALLAVSVTQVLRAEIPIPVAKNPNIHIQLVASEPDIVTPIGMVFDAKGRLLVIESHTHFPPKNYAGPKGDRIRLLEDTTGDGKADRIRTFFEGSVHTMSLATGKAGWIYVATRNEVFRIKDSTGNDVADKRESLVKLETLGKYPHNGLCGLAFDAKGRLYFGMGENLGEKYKLVGKARTIAGGGEGGNIFRCDANGAKLEKLATGFWNPFGICIGPHGRVFTVDNDPDSSPPCRLIHVVPGGDYGYQFRYGRSGQHPLQAWNGELPGTLPMIAGTGEAPCEVRIIHGKLWATSWGDNRIETFQLKPRGASFGAERRTIIEGTAAFRPVGLLQAKDGSLFVSDWADKSYPVHGKGRIWKITWTKPAAKTEWPKLTNGEKRAEQIRNNPNLDALADADPFLRTAAMWSLVQSNKAVPLDAVVVPADRDPGILVEYIRAMRWRLERGADTSKPRDWFIKSALESPDADVRMMGLRWVGDLRLKEFRSAVEKSMSLSDTTPQYFLAALATREWLDAGTTDRRNKPIRDRLLLEVITDEKRSAELRAIALRMIDPNYKPLTNKTLLELSSKRDLHLKREAVRTLVLRDGQGIDAVLAKVAKRETQRAVRADAVWGLARRKVKNAKLLDELASDADADVKAVIRRSRTGPDRTGEPQTLPPQFEKWVKITEGKGDPDRGWRLFFGVAKCASCHTFAGRGRAIGPDLTNIGIRRPREKLVSALLEPFRDIAPQYTTHILRLKNGKTLTGLPVYAGAPRDKERYVDSQGKLFDVKPSDIEARKSSDKSIMPLGLKQLLSVQEIRDLLALLERGAEAL